MNRALELWHQIKLMFALCGLMAAPYTWHESCIHTYNPIWCYDTTSLPELVHKNNLWLRVSTW